MKNVGIMTTSRADYSIYFPVARALQKMRVNVGFYVTGSHLSKAYGLTVKAIEADGFEIKARVPCVLKDSPLGMAQAMAAVTSGMAKALVKKKPELMLVLGDRYEMHAAALACVAMRVPLMHLHGGELTLGALDEYFRHSLTKLSHVHASATAIYAKRVMQMGEDKRWGHVSGAPGLDNALAVNSLSAAQMQKQFNVNIHRPFILVTFHPVTTDLKRCAQYADALCQALGRLKGQSVIITAPNADPGTRQVADRMRRFVKMYPDAVWVENFGTVGYITAMRHAAAMVGNSSSGIIEAASFELPVLNIGNRQEGRVYGKNVIHVDYTKEAIQRGLTKVLSLSFRRSLKGMKNLYGDGHAGVRIARIIKALDPKALRAKRFQDRA